MYKYTRVIMSITPGAGILFVLFFFENCCTEIRAKDIRVRPRLIGSTVQYLVLDIIIMMDVYYIRRPRTSRKTYMIHTSVLFDRYVVSTADGAAVTVPV